MTVDEALFELGKQIDQAAVARLEKLEAIHGKGTGALRVGVQKFLKSHPWWRINASARSTKAATGSPSNAESPDPQRKSFSPLVVEPMRRFILAVLTGLLCGCGSDIAVTPSASPPLAQGGIVVRHNLERSIGSEVTHLRVAGSDEAGNLTFGPQDLPKAAEVRFAVPLTTRMLNIEYYANSTKVGAYQATVAPVAGSEQAIEDPAWSAGTGVHIQPFVFYLFPNAVGRLQALDSHGEELPVTWRPGIPINVGVSPDGSIKAVTTTGSGFVYATTLKGREQTFCTYVVVDPAAVQSLQLPATTRVTIGTNTTTLVPTMGPVGVVGGTWISSDPNVARVDDRGVVTGVTKGSATLTVTANNKSASTRVNVVDPYQVWAELFPRNPNLKENDYIQFSVAGHYTDGSVRDDTNFFTYSTSDKNVLQLSNSNFGTAFHSGRCTVTATRLEVSSSVNVTVDL